MGWAAGSAEPRPKCSELFLFRRLAVVIEVIKGLVRLSTYGGTDENGGNET